MSYIGNADANVDFSLSMCDNTFGSWFLSSQTISNGLSLSFFGSNFPLYLLHPGMYISIGLEGLFLLYSNAQSTYSVFAGSITKNGVSLGEEERISPLDALKAVTKNAAYQYFEEDIKGTIKEGKLADLVILDKNILKVEPMEIKDIQVLETIKEGETIFKK